MLLPAWSSLLARASHCLSVLNPASMWLCSCIHVGLGLGTHLRTLSFLNCSIAFANRLSSRSAQPVGQERQLIPVERRQKSTVSIVSVPSTTLAPARALAGLQPNPPAATQAFRRRPRDAPEHGRL